ncbi:uncharacterized protein LOC115398558 [Salarias fasciatus]|uniref:uncharacterized protein LOC115391025 n=1 Tax=Salarias fasciatus TaxID=181472 RepID=UPI0011768DCA|nr:uncharacterized protein LOC115391025 [Salarias fasciatus]XP_029951921.1 uncharacterized protein LOC115391727 [Salarias fasciatus]XP_029961653.1 uncharacterized protein LOC115398558 [Salarias fasciatus]
MRQPDLMERMEDRVLAGEQIFLGPKVWIRGKPVITVIDNPLSGQPERCTKHQSVTLSPQKYKFDIKTIKVGSFVETAPLNQTHVSDRQPVKITAIWATISDNPLVLFEGTIFLPQHREDPLTGCKEYQEGGKLLFPTAVITDTLMFLHHKCFWEPNRQLGIGTKSTATNEQYCQIVDKKIIHNSRNKQYLMNTFLHSHIE